MKQYTVVHMHSKYLNTDMKIFIMLPKNYNSVDRYYPVLYMHDGQNLFDEKLSYKGEIWGVCEAYEEHLDLPEVIVVGIVTEGDFRTDVLVPFKFNWKDLGFPEYGSEDVGGRTDDYLSFITKELKPHIDHNYRSYKSPKNTAIMGSSFGGVCSLYAAITQQNYFSRFGCLSNAYYVVQNQMESIAKKADLSGVKKLYLDTGTKETSNAIDQQLYIDSNQSIYDLLKGKIDDDKIKFSIIKDAIHSEESWRERLPQIIKYLFND